MLAFLLAVGLTLAAAYEAYPSKAAILTGIGRDIDARLFASLEDDPLDGSPKDRLFDLLMRRFDALNDHRREERGPVGAVLSTWQGEEQQTHSEGEGGYDA